MKLYNLQNTDCCRQNYTDHIFVVTGHLEKLQLKIPIWKITNRQLQNRQLENGQLENSCLENDI